MGGRRKGGRCVGLTTLPPSCAYCLLIWESQTPGTLRTCPGLYGRKNRRNLGWDGGVHGAENAPPMFLLCKERFLATDLNRGKKIYRNMFSKRLFGWCKGRKNTKNLSFTGRRIEAFSILLPPSPQSY